MVTVGDTPGILIRINELSVTNPLKKVGDRSVTTYRCKVKHD